MGQHDPEVQEKYGEGAFSDRYGHIGGRVYVSRGKSCTLVVSIGPSWIIEDLSIARGVQLPEDVKEREARCRKLPKRPEIGLGLRLGDSEREVVSKLGPPRERKVDGTRVVLQYNTDYEEDDRVSLFYDAVYTFLDGELDSISIHDGC